MKAVANIGGFILGVMFLALLVGLASLLIQFTAGLDHGYLRTFLITAEISTVIIAIIGLLYIGAPE